MKPQPGNKTGFPFIVRKPQGSAVGRHEPLPKYKPCSFKIQHPPAPGSRLTRNEKTSNLRGRMSYCSDSFRSTSYALPWLKVVEAAWPKVSLRERKKKFPRNGLDSQAPSDNSPATQHRRPSNLVARTLKTVEHIYSLEY